MDALVIFMQGKELDSYPIFLKYIPEFQEALKKIEQMKEKGKKLENYPYRKQNIKMNC